MKHTEEIMRHNPDEWTEMEPLGALVSEMGYRAACTVLDLALEAKTLPVRVVRHVKWLWSVCK